MSTATHSIEVSVPLAQAYATWRDFENWPRFMPALKEALDTGDSTGLCTLATPFGKSQVHTRIINEHAGESFQWNTTSGDLEFKGKVEFEALSESSTRVTVQMEYHAPGGVVVETIARWLHEDPCAELPNELQRFKQFVEGGSAASA